MMYNNKFAAAIKVDGKVLREFDDSVYLNFGSEYTILLKNLNTKRALVTVKVDGIVVSGSGIVVDPGSDVELKRSISNGNLDRGNHFKFIEMTDKIASHRGTRIEDGLVTVEVQYEKQSMVTDLAYLRNYDTIFRGLGNSSTLITHAVLCNSNPVLSHAAMSTQAMSAQGITVPGSECNQSFNTVSSFPLESQKYVMVFKLCGSVNEEKLTETITVDTTSIKPGAPSKTRVHVSAPAPICVTCGMVNRKKHKFCSECGTSLRVV